MTPEEFSNLKARAEQGDADSQCNLGHCYSSFSNRQGVPEDDVQAVFWYYEAAKQEHAEAMFSLGRHFYCGKGTLEDKFSGVSWYSRAAYEGYPVALMFLASAYRYGKGVPKDEGEADYYRSLLLENMHANHGDKYALYKLGVRHWKGDHAQKNRVEAYALFTLAGGFDEYGVPRRPRVSGVYLPVEVSGLLSPEEKRRGQQRAKELQKEIERRRKALRLLGSD
jgi:TPR repeat protein